MSDCKILSNHLYYNNAFLNIDRHHATSVCPLIIGMDQNYNEVAFEKYAADRGFITKKKSEVGVLAAKSGENARWKP